MLVALYTPQSATLQNYYFNVLHIVKILIDLLWSKPKKSKHVKKGDEEEATKRVVCLQKR